MPATTKVKKPTGREKTHDGGNKTKLTGKSVSAFIKTVENPGRREDAEQLVKLYEQWTGYKPVMTGPTIIGFGTYDYVYETGRAGKTIAAGFSPRKANMVFYLGADFPGKDELLAKLGKFKQSIACIYVGRLSNIDLKVMEKLVKGQLKANKAKYDVQPT